MAPIPGRKTATEYLAFFSICVPLLMLLWLGLLNQPMFVTGSILFFALPVVGGVAGIAALVRVLRSSSNAGRTAALLGAAVNLLILAIFVSNAIA